ncbi:MAG: hypothetical protein K6A44_06705 [bacterium]|nr:hypothetical protein [bacterium]
METLQERHGIIAAGDVKRILNTDNSEIKDLCKQLKVFPKRDKRTGKAFFMREDVEFLKRMKDLHMQSSQYNEIDTRYVPQQVPVTQPAQDNTAMMIVQEFKKMFETMMSSQDKLIDKMQTTLESKLEGLDEVVVELIQVKTENENLRIKLNQMTKENYELKSNLEQFRPVGFGFYVK